MNKLTSRLQKMESLIIPKGTDAFILHVPSSQEHWQRRNEMTEAFAAKGYILWADEGGCVPDRPLWHPIPDDLLTDNELDALIDVLKTRITAEGESAKTTGLP